jgi:PAS domain S-box-containing protein
MEKFMTHEKNVALSTTQLAMVLEKIPVGITVIDQEGHILYYNEYCSRFVDRKPEYIGKDIRFCHQKPESIEKIKRILCELNEGKKKEFYYEAERGGNKLGVTVLPFDVAGKQIGFIQCFSIIR